MTNTGPHTTLPASEFTTTLAGFLDAHSDTTPNEQCSSVILAARLMPRLRSANWRIGKGIKPDYENQPATRQTPRFLPRKSHTPSDLHVPAAFHDTLLHPHAPGATTCVVTVETVSASSGYFQGRPIGTASAYLDFQHRFSFQHHPPRSAMMRLSFHPGRNDATGESS